MLTEKELNKKIIAIENTILDEKIAIRKMKKVGANPSITEAKEHGLKSVQFALKLYKGILRG